MYVAVRADEAFLSLVLVFEFVSMFWDTTNSTVNRIELTLRRSKYLIAENTE